ncbi:hypothetical protein [uncultured Ruegeria sp.]|uniref:hypothetical protein n=1 Tax=uncultured Ruegeria sp. TaxID=259304 RepID=UPI00260505D4|nr:hypothetical protein [uncultured Ruegeria sp.]
MTKYAAFTENKRLGAVLEHIKAEQDKSTPSREALESSGQLPTNRTPQRWLEL